MIDIHTHLLPGLDDGPSSMDESVTMLQIAAQAGTTDIVATPHANFDFYFDPQQVAAKAAELAAAVPHTVRIHTGCDFHFCYDQLRDALANPSKYTINGRRYLLIELPDSSIPETVDVVLIRLQAVGIVPVITHPERNWLLQRRRERLEEWVRVGCLIQVTAQSFFGRFGPEARDFSYELMRRDLVHFIASDAHDCEDRPPRLDEAHSYVACRFGPERATRLLVTNPRAVLDGFLLEPPPVRTPPRCHRRGFGA
jgi:protein-tyrosine phosphatase